MKQQWHGMTNISSAPFARVAEAVRLASEKSGLRMKAENYPLPKDYSDPEQDLYVPDPRMCSIWSGESRDVDHGPFWREYERLMATHP